MKIRERMLCSECAPRKLLQAEMTYKRSPGRDDVAACAFCGRIRPCKCYQIMTEKKGT